MYYGIQQLCLSFNFRGHLNIVTKIIAIEQGWATSGPRATCGLSVIFLRPVRCLKKKKKIHLFYIITRNELAA